MIRALLLVLSTTVLMAAKPNDDADWRELVAFTARQFANGHLTIDQTALILSNDWRHYYELLRDNMPCERW